MFGTRRIFSGNIFVSETCDFFNTISFCRFSNFKNLSTPVLALFQGAFSQNVGNFKSCDISLFHKLPTIEKFHNFYFQ